MIDCSKCGYKRIFKDVLVDVEGEVETPFGWTECCSRKVRRDISVCSVEGIMCSEVKSCPKTYLTEEECDQKEEDFDNYEDY